MGPRARMVLAAFSREKPLRVQGHGYIVPSLTCPPFSQKVRQAEMRWAIARVARLSLFQ